MRENDGSRPRFVRHRDQSEYPPIFVENNIHYFKTCVWMVSGSAVEKLCLCKAKNTQQTNATTPDPQRSKDVVALKENPSRCSLAVLKKFKWQSILALRWNNLFKVPQQNAQAPIFYWESSSECFLAKTQILIFIAPDLLLFISSRTWTSSFIASKQSKKRNLVEKKTATR